MHKVKSKIKAAVAQFGGPTSVINRSLHGIVDELVKKGVKVYGANHGMHGVVENDFLRLDLYGGVSAEKLRKVVNLIVSADDESKLGDIKLQIEQEIGCTYEEFKTLLKKDPDISFDEIKNDPGAFLGTSKFIVNNHNAPQLVQKIKDKGINYFYMIGGDTTAIIAQNLNQAANDINYDLNVVHVPKTIDNDLVLTDHTPGFGTAAKFVARACYGLEQENRSQPGIYVAITMGNNSGYLAASSTLLRFKDYSGPHHIYVPERHFDETNFLDNVENALSLNYKLSRNDSEAFMNPRAFIVVSEGIRSYEDGDIASDNYKLISKLEAERRYYEDHEGNGKLTTTSDLSKHLSAYFERILTENFKVGKSSDSRYKIKVDRVKMDVLGYMQRSFPDPSDVDALEAEYVGRMAVRYSLEQAKPGSVILERTGDGHTYSVEAKYVDLDKIAGKSKKMEYEFSGTYAKEIALAFRKYASPFIGISGLKGFNGIHMLAKNQDIGEIIPKEHRWYRTW